MTTDNDHRSAEAQARRLESVYEQLAVLLNQPGVAGRLRSVPREGDWSALQILGHVVEMIPYWLHHSRTLIEAPGKPPTFGRASDAPERLAGVERGASGQPDALLHQLDQEVQIAARTIRAMSPAERAKKGIHVRRGEMTVADVVEQLIVVHAEEHVAQARAALQA
jgi:hypothetical protein